MSATIAIRPATEHDAPAVARLVGSLIAQYGLRVPPDLASTLARDGFGGRAFFKAFLAEQASIAMGVVLFYPVYHPSCGAPGLFMEDLVVSPEARGEGIGRLLLNHLAAYARSNGFSGIEWTVAASNTAAQAFYARNKATRLDGKTHWEIAGTDLARFADAATPD
ncbi:MAG: GNAT family N-acetyltransferase [Proteobacteria bacterium]|nr:GNAT family N-acetyltransferase [Pseudomonadota bacterium]